MTTVTYSKVKFDKHVFLIGAIAVLVISLFAASLFSVTRILSIVLAVQFIIFLLVFRRPVWAMASLLVAQFTTADTMLNFLGTQVSVRFVWTVFALLLLIPIIRKQGGIELGRQARRVIIPAVIFFILVTVANVLNIGIQGTFNYLREISSGLVVLILLPATIKDERDLKLLSLVALITCGLSSLGGVMQNFSNLGLPDMGLLGTGVSEGRVMGLTASYVHLGFDLPLVILPTISILLTNGVKANKRKFLIPLVLVMVVACYFTYTRTGIYSLAPGLFAIIILMKSRFKKQIFLLALIISVAFAAYSIHSGSRYSQGFTSEQSAQGRLVLWSAGYMIALDHPLFGIGPYKFQEVSVEYASEINPALMEKEGSAWDLANEPVHNDFLNVWLSFGTLALLAYLTVMVMIFINFFSSYRRAKKGFTKSLILGCIAAMASYIVNAATHNMMSVVLFLWVLAGLSIAADKIVYLQPRGVKELK